MFDWYEPLGEPRCPWCGTRLPEWQGKDAFNSLFVYREGEREPVLQRVDDDMRSAKEDLFRFALQRNVEIYSYDCDHAPVSAIALVRDRVWTETVCLPVRSYQRGDWDLVEEDGGMTAIDPEAPIMFVAIDDVVPAAVAALARDRGAEVVAVARAGTLPEVRRELVARGVFARVVGVARPGETDAWLARHSKPAVIR
jgi:hypothetical protein